MLFEIKLTAPSGADYDARDLGFLLHKNPANVHVRGAAGGTAYVFFTEATPERATAVLHLDIDPVALVRGRGQGSEGLLDQYVNDRPYTANSFLAVALGRSFGQTISGKSKERQALADRRLPLTLRLAPVAASGGLEVVEGLFAPLGYTIEAKTIFAANEGVRPLIDLTLTGEVRLAEALNHVYVLLPVIDNDKHYWINRDEIDTLIKKGEGWLATHPAKELIAKRALGHRRELVHAALDRLLETDAAEDEADNDATAGEASAETTGPVHAKAAAEAALEKPLRLHDIRLDTVADEIKRIGASSVLDLGCGEGRLIARLIKERGLNRIVGVDPSVRTLEVAARRLHLNTAGEALRERVKLQMGSLTYGDRRWAGFDAACLVEVIEHVDLARLSALEQSLFAFARPRHVIVTTPNREYNALFENMALDKLRHGDHRFEWTRAEFRDWAEGVAARNAYAVNFADLGPADATHGAPSQMAVFSPPDEIAAGEAGP
jgi:3' terminal RNA ribose 2'-O-methyltransferase Hen1